MESPSTCGLCERYFEGHCTPIKGKHGHEPVSFDQKPSINCPYNDGKCNKCGAPLVNGNCADECTCKQ